MRTVLLVLLAALAAPLSACGRDAAAPPRVADDEAGQLLHRRVWLDHEPRSQSDRFHVMVFGEEHHGIYQDRTIWKGNFELFKYEAKDGGLVLRLPASKKVVKTGYRIERVQRGNADVRLTLNETPAGPTVYWGYKFDGGDDASAWIEATFGGLKP